MNRREFGIALGALPLLASVVQTASAAESPPPPKPKIGMLIYPGMILQDLVGPQTVFSILQADVRLVWKDKNPVATDVGIALPATDTFDTCPAELDVLFVPGGLGGSIACMKDARDVVVVRCLVPRPKRRRDRLDPGHMLVRRSGRARSGGQAMTGWRSAAIDAISSDARSNSSSDMVKSAGVGREPVVPARAPRSMVSATETASSSLARPVLLLETRPFQ